MPAASNAKRVKNKRISRPFIIGSEAWPLEDSNRKPDTPPDHTKGWRVYVKAADGQPDITRWLKKVSFKIYHTYEQPTRVFESEPFSVEETGWGGFPVDIRLFFTADVQAKPEYRSHYLQLEPYGPEAQQETQRREKMVRSEFLEIIEFSEPTEALWDALTDPSQPTTRNGAAGGGAGKRGKGKGKANTDQGASVEMPETATTTNPFAKFTERQLLEMLKKAEGDIDALVASEKGRVEEKRKELAQLKPEAVQE